MVVASQGEEAGDLLGRGPGKSEGAARFSCDWAHRCDTTGDRSCPSQGHSVLHAGFVLRRPLPVGALGLRPSSFKNSVSFPTLPGHVPGWVACPHQSQVQCSVSPDPAARSVALRTTGSSSETGNLGPIPDPLNQNLHLIKAPGEPSARQSLKTAALTLTFPAA